MDEDKNRILDAENIENENDADGDSVIESTNANEGNHLQNVVYVQSMFENWFLDYASYSILDRALPDVYDGLKPVQRRILHSMSELEDGRMNKVANIVGNTMKYHPHGDAAIGDAIVQLGQKEMTIDTQGNWGNILTGDPAAAPRYIEARLSKLALEVVFNPKITQWKMSYDGRNKEPIQLPIRFPLLLAQGVKGIAVGVPIGDPNSSPRPTLTDGAVPTITLFVGSAIAAITLSISDLSVIAPVGQTLIHCPHPTHGVSAKLFSKAQPILVSNPRPFGPITATD